MKMNKKFTPLVLCILLLLVIFMGNLFKEVKKNYSKPVFVNKEINTATSPASSATPQPSVLDISPSPSFEEQANNRCEEFFDSLAKGGMVTLESNIGNVNELDSAEKISLEKRSEKTKDIIRKLNEDTKNGSGVHGRVSTLLSDSSFTMEKTQFSVDSKRHIYSVITADCPDFFTASLLFVIDDTNNKVIGILADQSLSVSSFTDLDNDGNLELFVDQANGGNCWNCSWLKSYRIQSGSLKYIELYGIQGIVTPINKVAHGFTVVVLDTTWEWGGPDHARGIGLVKYFRINGQKIEEVTKEYASELLSDRDSQRSDFILRTLLIYESIGERAKGVEVFEKLCLERIASKNDLADKEELRQQILEVKKQFKESDHFYPPLGYCETQAELFRLGT